MTRASLVLAAVFVISPLALGGSAHAFHNGYLPDCGGGTTSNCLVSFTVQNAGVPGNVGDIKFQWDSNPGNLFVMAWNTTGPLGQQHDLGPTLTSASKITLVVKPATTFTPTGVMSMASLDSWGWNAATKELTIVGSPASGSWTTAACNATSGGCSVNKADFDFSGIFMFSAFEMDPSAAPPEMASIAVAFKANLFGGHISTNAQAFTPPTYDPATSQLKFRVASAHCKASSPGVSCTPNTGFFNAFVPNTFIQNIWGINPSSLSGAQATIEGQGSAVATLTAVPATSISPAGVKISYSGFTFSAPNIAIQPKTSSAQDDAPATVPDSATAGPVNASKPVRIPQSGKVAVPVTVSNGAKIALSAGTSLTVDGVAFRGLLYQPFAALDPSGGTYASVHQIGVSGIGTGREVKIDPPATLALPVPAGSDPAAYQPVAIDATGGPAFLVGKVDGSTVTVSADRIKDGLNRYGLAKVPRPEVRTIVAAPAAVQRGSHALWAGQSRSIDLAAGQLVDVAVKLLNTGTETWTRDVPGKEVRLGSSAPLDNTRDFDKGVLISPIAGTTRFAAQAEAIVQPGEVGTLNMRLRAPLQRGTYQVFVRPVVDGVVWMEDQGIVVELTVK